MRGVVWDGVHGVHGVHEGGCMGWGAWGAVLRAGLRGANYNATPSGVGRCVMGIHLCMMGIHLCMQPPGHARH